MQVAPSDPMAGEEKHPDLNKGAIHTLLLLLNAIWALNPVSV